MARPSLARRDLLALILAATCWGVGTVVSKAALESIPPLTLLPIQLAASLAILVVLLRARGIPLRSDGPALLGRLGLLNPGIAYALSLVGLTMISASLSVLLWALEPLLILALAVVVLRERVTPTVVVLSLAAVVGMVLVVYEPAAGGQAIGVALTVAGVACCAVYTILTRRFIPEARETGSVVLAQQVHALVLALVVVLLVGLAGGAVVPSALTPLGLASAIGSGALYYAAAYWFYLGALRHVPASLAAVSFYLIPVIGVAAGALLLDERLGPAQWLGAAIVLAATATILQRSVSSSVEAASVSAPA